MIFTSERLVYTKFQDNHFPDYIKLVSNEAVMKHITGSALNLEEAKMRFQVALAADKNVAELGFVTVTEKETGNYIGLGKIVPFENGMTEVGYALLPEAWGKGYASEITKRLVDYAKELKNIEELIGVVDPENGPSIRVLTKQGFVLFREVELERGRRADYVLKLKA